jgi:hypothetical protein
MILRSFVLPGLGLVATAFSFYYMAPEAVRAWARHDPQTAARAVSLAFDKNSRMVTPFYEMGYQRLMARRLGELFAVIPVDTVERYIEAAKETAKRTADEKLLTNWHAVEVKDISYKTADQVNAAKDVILCTVERQEPRPAVRIIYPEPLIHAFATRELAAGFSPPGYKIVNANFVSGGQIAVGYGNVEVVFGTVKFRSCGAVGPSP